MHGKNIKPRNKKHNWWLKNKFFYFQLIHIYKLTNKVKNEETIG